MELQANGSRKNMVRTRTAQRQWWTSALAAMAAIALHAVVIAAFTMGASAGKREQSAGAGSYAAVIPDAGKVVSAIILMDPAAVSSQEGIAGPGRPLKVLSAKDLPMLRLIRVAEPLLPSSGADSDGRSDVTSVIPVDGAERVVLFGRYVNQIVARIERAWVRPQARLGGPDVWDTAGSRAREGAGARFRCRVQIKQSTSGQVLEITLLDCDSSPAWQQSLVDAIDAASPLPAPPIPAVFARSLVLNFRSAVPPAGRVEAAAAPAAVWSGVR